MKIKFYYLLNKRGGLWGGHCSVIDEKKYDIGYSIYLVSLLK